MSTLNAYYNFQHFIPVSSTTTLILSIGLICGNIPVFSAAISSMLCRWLIWKMRRSIKLGNALEGFHVTVTALPD